MKPLQRPDDGRRACAAGSASTPPTLDEPLIVVVIDELANLTAYLTDRHLRDRIKAALGCCSPRPRRRCPRRGRDQDPRKEVLPFRDLFPTRIGARLSEAAQVDMVLGDGMRDRGALCDRIPLSLPGRRLRRPRRRPRPRASPLLLPDR